MESTKDQALMDLQSAARVQQLKLDTLERSLELTQRELKLARAEIDHDLTSRLSPIKVAGLIIVLLGATSVFSVLDTLKETEKTVMKDMEQSLKT